jgi:cytochrome b subunit of formate dehydrogenase
LFFQISQALAKLVISITGWIMWRNDLSNLFNHIPVRQTSFSSLVFHGYWYIIDQPIYGGTVDGSCVQSFH